MPWHDGFDVYEALKSDPVLACVPVIFVTSHDATLLVQVAGLQKGAADFVTKPYTPAVLQARVRNLLDLKRRTDAAS